MAGSADGPTKRAADRWAEELAGWAIPPEILAAAPESPWTFSPGLFQAPDPDDAADSPSRQRALEALEEGGTVLDVGAGAGAAGLPLAVAGRARRLTAVDQSGDMLAALRARADQLGVDHVEVLGPWPEVAPAVPPADVVVCHHVFYNVSDLVPFARALTDHARQRVVVELTATHPRTSQTPLWQRFHNLGRPVGPTADDARAVLAEAGLDVAAQSFLAPARDGGDRAAWVAQLRRHLCLPAARDPEIDALLPDRAQLAPREIVALWWEGSAS